ncbi:hypothetical protein Lal_00000861 [Lupinus albus]|nr:hypothetical protein Lal_00000861 [Lupinus albus]
MARVLDVAFGGQEELIFFLLLSLTRVKPPSPFLQHFGVSMNGETKVPLNLHESKIDVDVVHKMGFFADPRDRSGRTHLHRSDKKNHNPLTNQNLILLHHNPLSSMLNLHHLLHLTPTERGSIQDRGSILKTSQDISEKIQKNTLSRRYWFVIIKKGEIVKKISASDLGMVLMKTPTSPKIRKGRLLMKTKKIKASRQ